MAQTQLDNAPVASSAVEIPRLDGITIDGDASDWPDRAFRVDVLHSAPPPRRVADQFDARVRLAWDERGLLVLADVTDADVHESPSTAAPGDGASVEIFLADVVGGRQRWQASISPGVDPAHPQLRAQIQDNRSPQRKPAPSIAAASRKTPHGYIVEARLPWDALGIDAKTGQGAAFQIYINQASGAGRSRLLWFAKEGANWDSRWMQPLRLADAPGAAVTAATSAAYEHFRRTRFSIATLADAAGKTVQIRSRAGQLGAAILKPDGRLASATLAVPMPPIGEPYGPLSVWIDEKQIEAITLPDPDELRADAQLELKVVATSAVFKDAMLPEIDFLNPGDAEDVIGPYAVHTTYYDSEFKPVTQALRPGRYGAVVDIKPEIGKPFKRYLTLYRAAGDFNWRNVKMNAALQMPAALGIDPGVIDAQSAAAADYASVLVRDSRHGGDELAVLLCGLSETTPGAGALPRRLGPAGKNAAWWYELKKRIGDLTAYRSLVHVPDRNPPAPQTETKYPLILFLHGSGERGDVLERVAVNGVPKILKTEPDWPFRNQFIVVSPQCPAGVSWDPLQLRDLLDEVVAKYPVDPDRVYLTGLSMGGYGSWDLAMLLPERFAAIVPICGGGDPADVAQLKEIPTWVFHGGADPTVPIENSYEMVQALRALHGRVKFTVYPERGHNSWEPAYDDPRLYEWLLKQRRGNPQQPQTRAPGTMPADE